MADLETADLDAQIAQLEALKAERIAKAEVLARQREKEATKILVRSTPTKPKPKTPASSLPAPPSKPNFGAPSKPAFSTKHISSSKAASSSTSTRKLGGQSRVPLSREKPAPAALPSLPPPRTSFASALAAKRAATNELEVVHSGAERGDDLTVTNDLRLGPGEFGPDPEGEDEWRSVEPNSGIRLSRRDMPHSDVQDHLYGRYFLSLPQIYSVARLSRDGATYDIPVDTDWVTIAVVAERSDIRVSGTKSVSSGNGGDEDDDDDEDDDGNVGGEWASTRKPIGKNGAKGNGKDKGKRTQTRQRVPRKYINLTLVSLPSRASLNGKSAGGDARAQLLLFESDAIVHGKEGEDRSYRGGSGGAYEKWCNLAVGSVIAIVSPRILRPIKSSATPHPLTLPLAFNPQSDASIAVIGHAMDLGRCAALQRDGKRCRTWVDSRLEQICEYHACLSMKRGRAGRGELASATTPMEFSSRPFDSARPRGPGKTGYDVRTKTGLLPGSGPQADRESGGATYVVGSGKVVRTGQGPAYSEPMGTLGRKRRLAAEEIEGKKGLARLMERGDNDSPGYKYLRAMDEDKEGDTADTGANRSIANMERAQGLHSTNQPYEDPAKRAASIASLMRASSDRPLKLGRPPGPKRLSNVAAPNAQPGVARAEGKDADLMIDLD